MKYMKFFYSELNFQVFIRIVNSKRGKGFCQGDVGNRLGN